MNTNKKLIGLIIGILLIGTVIVTGVAVRNRDITVSKEQKTALESVGLSDYKVTDYENDDEVQRCLKKNDAIDKCFFVKKYYMNCTNETEGECFSWERVNLSEEDVLKILDAREETIIKNIANATIERQNRKQKEQIREGTTTIK